jgi:hypothetical protein
MVEIVVAGYPRSGNVWVSRLLGDALNVPVVGVAGGRDSLAAEGKWRRGKGYIKQAHYWPGKSGNLHINPKDHKGITFLHMVRDPRDIAISAAHYWTWTIDEALGKMIDGPGPLDLPPWVVFVESWLKEYVPILRYEDFHQDAEKELTRLLEHLELEPQKNLAEVVNRQSFVVKRAELERRGNRYPFGRTAQLTHMRKGTVGEWRETFTIAQIRRSFLAWKVQIRKLGY